MAVQERPKPSSQVWMTDTGEPALVALYDPNTAPGWTVQVRRLNQPAWEAATFDMLSDSPPADPPLPEQANGKNRS